VVKQLLFGNKYSTCDQLVTSITVRKQQRCEMSQMS